ncbi:hypothetical protein FRACA_510025 [Frankia canadensis]|uniref:Uncharacterized protein n=1 Tax=Frankia canadensis TaxID=1836972 RepID=A0A2I2KYJ6_9ACTN|nr:hypothetical protein FRACA_510025 [Frankia canadensis]SOU58016.1 hypothetical protein FRACA_510025 [Frankia canadensis]
MRVGQATAAPSHLSAGRLWGGSVADGTNPADVRLRVQRTASQTSPAQSERIRTTLAAQRDTRSTLRRTSPSVNPRRSLLWSHAGVAEWQTQQV